MNAMRIVGRLLVLLAVLLMPLGMQSAAAAPATPADHDAMMAGMPIKHCPDQGGNSAHTNALATCSMACASALPAQDVVRDAVPPASHQLVKPTVSPMLNGIHPEIATPPPRQA